MFERSRIYKDDLKVETVIDFQDDDKERFFTELYEWLEESIDSDVEIRDSFLWEEKSSFAYYAADYYELPNGDGWERSDGPVSSIKLKRKCPYYDAAAEIKIIPLYEISKRWEKELTDQWKNHGVEKGREFAILTDEVTRAWPGTE